MSKEIRKLYQEKIASCVSEIGSSKKRINVWSAYRLITLLSGIALFYYSLNADGFWWPVLVFFLTILIFSLLVRQQNMVQQKVEYLTTLHNVLCNELDSLDFRNTMYSDGADYMDDSHPYCSDLDVFGTYSLFNLVNRCSTEPGLSYLADWLKAPADIAEIISRQGAVREMGEELDWRHDFQVILYGAGNNSTKGSLIRNLKTEVSKPSRIIMLYINSAPWLFFGSAILAGLNPAIYILTMALGIGNLILVQGYNSRILRSEQQAGKISVMLRKYSDAVSYFIQKKWQSVRCVRIREELLGSEGSDLPSRIRDLSSIMNQLNLGLSSIGPVLNLVMAWNVRYYYKAENWKEANRLDLLRALEKIGEIEALMSLSTLHANRTDWSFPELMGDHNYTLYIREGGHPLIPEESSVRNDYALEDSRCIDIITGSNMAGKSTFLRMLGLNAVLAFSGAPVNAAEMRLSWFKPFTYMRVKDSLNENTSTFKAELNRLQELLAQMHGPEKIFFLIDEMLRGTNSADKYEGSKAVIKKLISLNGAGIIATHDLQISELEEEHPGYIRNFHFDISMRDEEMIFDYKLKSGACNTFNAKALLKSLGIEI